MKNIRLMQRLLIIMGLVIIILGLNTCYGVLKERANSSLIEDLEGELLAKDQRFIERIKEDSTREYTQNQLLSTERNARILAEDKAKGFRKVQTVVKTNLVLVHDTILAEYTTKDTLYLGREFCHQTQYDTICGTIDSIGVHIRQSPTSLGTMTTVIGSEKYGFLKLKSKPVVQVSFTNPNVRVTSMANVVVKQPKPKRLAWLISGIAIGITGGILLMAN